MKIICISAVSLEQLTLNLNLLFGIYAKTKEQISCMVTAQLISTFVFGTDSKIPLLPYPKFQASSHHSCTARLVSDLVGNPKYRFSCDVTHLSLW